MKTESFISFEEASNLDGTDFSGDLDDLGLKSSSKYWYSSKEKRSFLFIIDPYKWMLAKIKYGI